MNPFTRLRAWMRTPAPYEAGPMESALRTSGASVHHTGSVSTDGGGFANTGIILTAHGVDRVPVIPGTRANELRHTFASPPYVVVSRAAANYAEVLLINIVNTGQVPGYARHDPDCVAWVCRALSDSIEKADNTSYTPDVPEPEGVYDSEHGLDETAMAVLGTLHELRNQIVINRGANTDATIIDMIDAYALGLHGDEDDEPWMDEE